MWRGNSSRTGRARGGRNSARHLTALLAALWLTGGLTAAAGEAARPGTIQISDGDVLEGPVQIQGDEALTLQNGSSVKTFRLGQIAEIRLFPEKEDMVRKWRFPEAGKTRKEFFGVPYPLRQLRATVRLNDGEEHSGHLYPAVFLVEQDGQYRKVVAISKQRGKEGQDLQDIPYPVRIAFSASTAAPPAAVSVPLPPAALAPGAEVSLLTRPSLIRLPARMSQGRCTVASPLTEKAFAAAMASNRIEVAWPSGATPDLLTTVSNAVVIAKDFFDERKLLGVYEDPGDGNVYSLLQLRRRGATTMEGPRTQPWQVNVWRWRYDEEKKTLMLCGRGYFFRGILERGALPPPVAMTEGAP